MLRTAIVAPCKKLIIPSKFVRRLLVPTFTFVAGPRSGECPLPLRCLCLISYVARILRPCSRSSQNVTSEEGARVRRLRCVVGICAELHSKPRLAPRQIAGGLDHAAVEGRRILSLKLSLTLEYDCHTGGSSKAPLLQTGVWRFGGSDAQTHF